MLTNNGKYVFKRRLFRIANSPWIFHFGYPSGVLVYIDG